MTIEARRHRPRVNLREIAYVHLGSGNRGVILDVSEGGLRFKTASPIATCKDVRFSLRQSDRAQNERTEGSAQLAWADESRTTGGLSFTTVPEEIRQQIREWIERGESGDTVRTATANALREEELAAAVAATATRDSVSERGDRFAAADDSVEGIPGQQPWLTHPHVLSRERGMSMFSSAADTQAEPVGITFVAPRPIHHRWAIAFLVLLIVLGAATAAAEYYYPSEAQHVMRQVQSKVERFVNPAEAQRAAETENASMAGATRFEGAFEPGKSPRDPFAEPVVPPSPVPSKQAIEGAQGDTSHAVTTPDMEAPKNSSETDLELAQTYLSHSDNPDEKAKALQLLWLATEKGNVDAEVELADLYARGDGVAKSCVQARILLKAAAAVNAPVAQPKLDALDQSGCS